MTLRTTLSTVAAAVLAAGLVTGSLTACGDGGTPDSPTATASPTPAFPGRTDDAVAQAAEAATAHYSAPVVTTDLPDGEHDDSGFVERIRYPVRGGHADPAQNWADFYLPPGHHDEDTVPLVVFLHGGAWHKGATGARHIAQRLTERGIAVYNIEYRDIDGGGGWPQTFTDVADALDYVPELDRRHPEITTDDETVVGHSAGAQLAAWAGTRGDLDRGEIGADPTFTPTRVVSLAGPLDLRWSADHGDANIVAALGGTPDQVPERYDSVDPIRHINPRIPVVAVHGTDDSLVSPENSERYVDRVTALGGKAKLVLLRGQNHISFLRQDSPALTRVLDIIHAVTTYPADRLSDRLDGGTTELTPTTAR